ncbi:hypothetical protein HHK36_025556 [Tetracentron sinense]|uniref:Uncharacterized protein n=1 Tax=Tetracentron sinense TaxID=13715 RepID=A0A834YLI2_TETSI|nr:hypothetical protein HHK36_025556 [Tetracentron sinense]
MPLYDCMLLLKPHVRKEVLMDLVARAVLHMVQGQLMQMTMMVTPNFNKDLHYLNKEDRLLRLLLVKHRNAKYGLEFMCEGDGKGELSRLPSSSIYNDEEIDEDDEDEEEYEVEEEEEEDSN